MNNLNSLYATIVVVFVIAGWGLWLYMAQPDSTTINSYRQPPESLAQIDFDFLESNELESRKIYGELPINLENAGIGREDPFAGN